MLPINRVKKLVSCSVLFLTCHLLLAQSSAWENFARVKFISKYQADYGVNIQVPQFDWTIRLLEGKEVTLKGYFVPTDLQTPRSIILSRVPNSSCFFCGGAGPETVARINFKQSIPKLKTDEILKVKGKLRLNDSDHREMSFILEDAEILDK